MQSGFKKKHMSFYFAALCPVSSCLVMFCLVRFGLVLFCLVVIPFPRSASEADPTARVLFSQFYLSRRLKKSPCGQCFCVLKQGWIKNKGPKFTTKSPVQTTKPCADAPITLPRGGSMTELNRNDNPKGACNRAACQISVSLIFVPTARRDRLGVRRRPQRNPRTNFRLSVAAGHRRANLRQKAASARSMSVRTPLS